MCAGVCVRVLGSRSLRRRDGPGSESLIPRRAAPPASSVLRAQLSFWLKDDPCYIYPSLDIDVAADFFFLVRRAAPRRCAPRGRSDSKAAT